jgi:hypothetical protein
MSIACNNLPCTPRDGLLRPFKTPLFIVLLQNRGGNLSDTTLAYDLSNGRNLNIIKDRQTGLTLWDNERANGSTYYYHKAPEAESCQALVNMRDGQNVTEVMGCEVG